VDIKRNLAEIVCEYQRWWNEATIYYKQPKTKLYQCHYHKYLYLYITTIPTYS